MKIKKKIIIKYFFFQKEFEILNDKRRLTVAITRAKQKLILIGCIDCLKSYKPLNELICSLEKNDFIFKLENLSQLE